MYHSCSLVFPLHLCLKCAVKNDLKKISVSNYHSQVPRWRAFNFAQGPVWWVLGMPSNSPIDQTWTLKTCMQKVLIFEKQKKSAHQLDSNPWPPECKSTALPIELYGCGFWWNVAQILRLQPSAECKLISSDKLEVGGWCVYGVRQLICRFQQSQVR